MKIKEKLELRLNKLFNTKYKHIEIQPIKGSSTYRWFSTNTYPCIICTETITNTMKAKELFYYINDQKEIEITLESFEHSTFFKYIKMNPNIKLEIN